MKGGIRVPSLFMQLGGLGWKHSLEPSRQFRCYVINFFCVLCGGIVKTLMYKVIRTKPPALPQVQDDLQMARSPKQ
jgi:hypothetical protein